MRELVAEALEVLGKSRLVLAIHDACFPSRPEEDVGRGTPYARGGVDFLRFAHALGFDSVQLGPQGQTSPGNASPYDGDFWLRNVLSLDLSRVLEREAFARLVASRPAGTRVSHRAVHEAIEASLSRAARGQDIHDFCQPILRLQHEQWRRAIAPLRVYGDLQAGFSARDVARDPSVFLSHLVMGAPPSRTTPAGQPWGYPVLDPEQLDDPAGAGAKVWGARLDRMLADYDGLRIDHPHGLVCPWVYRAGGSVVHGSRLRSSPDDPELARFAIAREFLDDPAGGVAHPPIILTLREAARGPSARRPARAPWRGPRGCPRVASRPD
jgi:4-alpha-glucanotransferase